MATAFSAVSDWFGSIVGNKPSLDDQIQQKRDLNFQQQQGINNQLQVLQNQILALQRDFANTPASDQEACERIFLRIRALKQEESNLSSKLILLQQAARNMNTTKETFDTIKVVHESNQMVDTITKENRKVLGLTPENVMNRMRTTNEKTDALTNIISDSAVSINQMTLDKYQEQKKELDTDMARYRASLSQESGVAKREQLLTAMPHVPLATPAPITYIQQPQPTQTSVTTQDPWAMFTK